MSIEGALFIGGMIIAVAIVVIANFCRDGRRR